MVSVSVASAVGIWDGDKGEVSVDLCFVSLGSSFGVLDASRLDLSFMRLCSDQCAVRN